jgi:hypothetical protein
VAVGETDGAVLGPGARAEVRLDAYPDLLFHARFESASPAAASPLGSPIKSFTARFRLDRSDPHLLPDLAAAVIIEPGPPGQGSGPPAAAGAPEQASKSRGTALPPKGGRS